MPIDLDGRGRHEPHRTARGYRIPLPDGKTVRTYTRVSTVVEVLEDKHRLDRFNSMKALFGAGRRPDLVLLAAGHDIDDDRSVFEDILDEAHGAADVTSKANIGSALHRFAEQVDAGTPLAEMPEAAAPYLDHLESYRRRMERLGFEIVHDHTEQVVMLDDERIAGQVDRVLRATRDVEAALPTRSMVIPKGTLIIGDLKTGGTLYWSKLKFATQVTIYANHEATWFPDSSIKKVGGTRGPRIDVDRTVAMIIHLPASDPAAPCTVHWVDCEKGYSAFMCAQQVRALRSDSSGFISDAVEEHVSFDEAHRGWLLDRLEAFKGNEVAALDLRLQWPLVDGEGRPRRLPAEPTAVEAELLGEVLSRLEAKYQMGFAPSPPGVEAGPSFIEQLERSTDGGA